MLNETQAEHVDYLYAVDTPPLASRRLRDAVERCLEAGMSPRAIVDHVGLMLWSKVKGGIENPEKDRRWPRDPLGGWSDDPRPAPEEVMS